MKLIELSQNSKKNSGKYFAMVDDEDFDSVSKHNWTVKLKRHTFYACTHHVGIYSHVYLHRFVLNYQKGDGAIVDHIDHNGLNCQKNNLRKASFSENCANRVSNKKGTSLYKGVRLCRQKNWNAKIEFNKKVYNLGYFKNEIDAALAYNKKAVEIHGEFAVLNEIKYDLY